MVGCCIFYVSQPAALSTLLCRVFIGGFVGDILLTREGLVQYSQLPTIAGLHVQLAQLLLQAATHTQHVLTSQQTLLMCSLDCHSSTHSLISS